MFISTKSGKIKKSVIVRSSIAILLSTIIIVTSILSVAALNDTFTINVDGSTLTVSSLLNNPVQIVKNANISLNENDNVDFNEKDKIITVNRAFDVILEQGDTATPFNITKSTVKSLLYLANIKLSENEVTVPTLDTVLDSACIVKIVPLIDVTVVADGETITKQVPQITVENILPYFNIKLGKDDVMSMDYNAIPNDGDTIQLDRIEYKTVTKTETIEHKVKETKTDELYEGETKEVKSGHNGEKSLRIEQKYVNGKLSDEAILSEKTTKKAITQEILVGTKENPVTHTSSSGGGNGIPVRESNGILYDANGQEVAYSNVLSGSSTAYYAPPGALTATGVPAYYGGVAVNPNIIPYGTKMFIVGDDGFIYGYATAIDTGGALMSGTALVDCYYPTYDECVTFGRRNMNVYILN